ncbi:MAG: hypothetical protein GC172_03285 [Phycisphaera sp.]|nr:hypothetical protein [Phycisphaera sp.]
MLSAIALAVSCVLGVSTPPEAEARKPSPVAAHPPDEISVGTFNIRYANDGDGTNAWRHRRAMVAEILREGDFWGLQEVLPSQLAEVLADCPRFTAISRTREVDPAKGEACPILYDAALWEADAKEQGTFWLSTTPHEPGSKSWDSSIPRIATFARFIERAPAAGAAPRALYIFNVHLDHRGAESRLEAARLVADRIAARTHRDPVVLVGDFNCGPASAPIAALLAHAGAGLRDAWRDANRDAPEQGTFNGWNERCGDVRIDFVLVNDAFAVRSCAIDLRKPGGRWPSDHTPVVARIGWRTAGRTPRLRRRRKGATAAAGAEKRNRREAWPRACS